MYLVGLGSFIRPVSSAGRSAHWRTLKLIMLIISNNNFICPVSSAGRALAS